MNARFFDPDKETMPLNKMREMQNERLRFQVERCYRNIPFYTEIFDQRGLKPKHIKTSDDLVNVPTLEKKDLKKLYPFGLLGLERNKIHRFAASSGTTGVPTVIGFSEKDWKITLSDILGRIYYSFGFDNEIFLYQSHGYGLFLGGVLFDHAMDTIGATLFPAGPGRTLAAVRWLMDMKHNAISGTPTFMQHLINKAKEEGIDPKKDWDIKVGCFGGETAAMGLRKRIVAEMPDDFAYKEQYGTSEVGGFCAYSCPDAEDGAELHVLADHFFLEVIDPQTGKRVEPGGQGDLVLTTLTREAGPVIRWNTRDIVRLSSEPDGCKCGRVAHQKISTILGRSDDVLKVRGTLIFPSQVEEILALIKGTTEAWQIVLEGAKDSLRKLKIEIEVSEDCWGNEHEMSKLSDRVREELISRLGTSGEIVLLGPNSLPRYEGKAIRVVEKK